MGIWKTLFGSTQPSQPQGSAVLDELLSTYRERIAELKAANEALKAEVAGLSARVLDLRKRVEMVPRLTTSQTTVHDWSPEEINDQPVFDGDADAKHCAEAQKKYNLTMEEWNKEFEALMQEHETTVKPSATN